MRVKLHTGELIEVEEPKQRHQIEYLELIDKYDKKKITLKDMAVEQDKFIVDLAKKTHEQVEDMALIDKNKILEAIKGRMIVVGPCNYKQDF